MPVVNLNYTPVPARPVYPRPEPPEITTVRSIARDGFAEKKFAMDSHAVSLLGALADTRTAELPSQREPARSLRNFVPLSTT